MKSLILFIWLLAFVCSAAEITTQTGQLNSTTTSAGGSSVTTETDGTLSILQSLFIGYGTNNIAGYVLANPFGDGYVSLQPGPLLPGNNTWTGSNTFSNLVTTNLTATGVVTIVGGLGLGHTPPNQYGNLYVDATNFAGFSLVSNSFWMAGATNTASNNLILTGASILTDTNVQYGAGIISYVSNNVRYVVTNGAGGGGGSGANTNLSNINPLANPVFNGSGISNVVVATFTSQVGNTTLTANQLEQCSPVNGSVNITSLVTNSGTMTVLPFDVTLTNFVFWCGFNSAIGANSNIFFCIPTNGVYSSLTNKLTGTAAQTFTYTNMAGQSLFVPAGTPFSVAFSNMIGTSQANLRPGWFFQAVR